MDDLSRIHENSYIAEVFLADLQIDRSYQRSPSQQFADKIAENWNAVAAERVLVSDRGTRWESDPVRGGLFLVNGQHRSIAAAKLGHEKIWAIIIDLSQETDPGKIEADLRLTLNQGLKDRPLERFKAQVRAGDEDSLAIVKILARFDSEINERNNAEQGINAVSTVEALYGADPTGALLNETLEVIREAFTSFRGRNVSSSMLKGIAWFIEQHSDEVDRWRWIEKLKLDGMESIHRRSVTIQSNMGGSLWMNYYRSIVDGYNKGLQEKSKLDWKLRGSGKFAARSKVGGISGFGAQHGAGPGAPATHHPESVPASVE